MNKKTIRACGIALLLVLWLGLSVFSWVKPADELSESERRPLDQFPAFSVEGQLDGTFMSDFESYTLDQFPLRDGFRQLKSLFHYYALRQQDNNGIYISDGYAAKLEYPLNETSVNYALERFQFLYNRYLRGRRCNIYAAVVPDKSYYLAEQNGYLAIDYEKLFTLVENGMPWAEYIDLTDSLNISSYYYTDTHWRQEKLLPVAQVIAQAMGVSGPNSADFTATRIDRPFYGVYYGQAALPLASEDLFVMESQILSDCTVYHYENGSYTAVYDVEKLDSSDLYDIFLSGTQPLLTIENPNADTDRELIVFRDSFGSSLVPLLVQDYASVTLVDIRYVNPQVLGQYLQFSDQDVLFLYSSLILNGSSALQ